MLNRGVQLRESGRCGEEVSMFLRFDTVDSNIYVFELCDRCNTCDRLATETKFLLADPESKIEAGTA